MTKKIAFFVEGATEQLFLKSLLTEIFGPKSTSIQESNIRGGSSCPISVTTLTVVLALGNERFYFLIYDCGGDSSIKSFIIDQQQGLIAAGYSAIIGLRDLYPIPLADLSRLKTGLNSNLDQRQVKITIFVSVMETEAWFLADYSHFQRIDNRLTIQSIKTALGIDYSNLNVESVSHPSLELDTIYRIVGKAYLTKGKKTKPKIHRTCSVLDYGNLYLNLPQSVPSLKDIIDELDGL